MSKMRVAAVCASLFAFLLYSSAAHAVKWEDVVLDDTVVQTTATVINASTNTYRWDVNFLGGDPSVYGTPRFGQFLVFGPDIDYTTATSSTGWSFDPQNPYWAIWYKGEGNTDLDAPSTAWFQASFTGPVPDLDKVAIHMKWVDQYGRDQSGWFATPEPGSAALLGLGLLGLIRRRRRAPGAR